MGGADSEVSCGDVADRVAGLTAGAVCGAGITQHRVNSQTVHPHLDTLRGAYSQRGSRGTSHNLR